jgi:plasmid stability protein
VQGTACTSAGLIADSQTPREVIAKATRSLKEAECILFFDKKLGNQENGEMKTTLDLPDALVKQVKLRAVREGRKLKDLVADLLRKGLAATANEKTNIQSPSIIVDKKTGLPLIECKHAASPDEEITPDRLADILLAQEVGWQHDASR